MRWNIVGISFATLTDVPHVPDWTFFFFILFYSSFFFFLIGVSNRLDYDRHLSLFIGIWFR